MLFDLGCHVASEARVGVGRQVFDRQSALWTGVVADVRLHVALPKPSAGALGDLGHVVGGKAENRGGLSRWKALDLGEPQDRSPALGQLTERPAHKRLVLAGRYPLVWPRGGGDGVLNLLTTLEVARTANRVDGCMAGGGEEVRPKGGGIVQPSSGDGLEDPDEGVGDCVTGVLPVARDCLGHTPGSGRVPSVQLLKRDRPPSGRLHSEFGVAQKYR
ncbi:MAG TPA: hypothetical protein VMZ73_03930 [Acidimicrobiales bacterium]|nr:hypothetical protein [Acidimicrobiales bacterium]